MTDLLPESGEDMLHDDQELLDPLGDAEEGVVKNRAKVGSARPSSLLYTYGPGAIMDLPSFSIMPAGLDDWETIWKRRDHVPSILEPRLLNVVRLHLGPQVDALRPFPWQPKRMGISSDIKPDASLALGTYEVTPLELTAAYASFANAGQAVLPYAIREIRDTAGQVLYRRSGSGLGRVAGRAEVMAMNEMMGQVIAVGTGKAAKLDRPVAGKTGTTQDFRDAWFMGYTADLVTGVWMGNDDNKPMKSVSGGGLPARLWRDYMLAAHAGLPPRALPLPEAAVASVEGTTYQPAPIPGAAPAIVDPVTKAPSNNPEARPAPFQRDSN